MSKISRNAPCWCGSGKKFKHCHYPEKMPNENMTYQQKNEVQSIPSFEEFLDIMGVPKPTADGKTVTEKLNKVRNDKKNGNRQKPSLSFIDKSSLLTPDKRKSVIDISAKYVDENWCGRSEMCLQFAILVKNLLKKEGVESKIVEGEAEYFNEEQKFSWNHFWLVTENEELIDCNIDSLPENPYCPEGLMPQNYWGPISIIPNDRKYRNKKEFTDKDEERLEKQDKESVIWKKNSIQEYEELYLE